MAGTKENLWPNLISSFPGCYESLEVSPFAVKAAVSGSLFLWVHESADCSAYLTLNVSGMLSWWFGDTIPGFVIALFPGNRNSTFDVRG